MIPTLTPTSGQPVIGITHGTDTFRLTCCEAFGLNGGTPCHETTDGIHYAGTGDWEQQGNALYMRRVITDSPAITYDLMLEALEGRIEIAATFRNKSGADWSWASWADFCLQHDPSMSHSVDLYDPDGSHTYIAATPARGGGMQTIATQAPDQIAASNTAHFYFPGINPAYPPIAGCIICRSNVSGTKWTGFYFEGSPGVFANFGQGNCTHSNPVIAPLPNGGAMTTRGRITFNNTTLGDVCANTPI